MNRAVFLDRDGVLVEDAGLIVKPEQLKLLPGTAAALQKLRQAEFRLVVVSNQAVVARGLICEAEVSAINASLETQLVAAGAPPLDGWYFCPHHPNATLAAYRVDCDCRKPRPGLLLRAARDLSLDLTVSFLVGDRITDVMAGQRAGCRTVLMQTGRHLAPPIETTEPVNANVQPDHACDSLAEAAEWILRKL